MHFCQLRKMYNNPTLKLDGTEILVVDQYKFLGVIFDKKTFIPHKTISEREMQQNPKTTLSNSPQRLECRSANSIKII